MYQDINLKCVECKSDFEWSAGEQKFINCLYEEGKVKGIIEPKRCPDCRQNKKKRYEHFAKKNNY